MQDPIALSVLDLSPVSAGSSSADALRNTLDLARLAERLGYKRYWLAEHHNSPFIATSVPEVMIGHVADVTQEIRVGSGGVMLPNHSPLHVAEAFRTLEALHPGRVDLGLGRAPGTDTRTALALRRSREGLGAEAFPDEMDELLHYLSDASTEDPGRSIIAMPAGVAMPEIWLLGSSGFSAQLAAAMGLRFAFAHHIDPEPAVLALRLYRELFRPSRFLGKPRAMLAVSVICAETDERAQELAWPIRLAILRLRQGRSAPLSPVEESRAYPYSPPETALIQAHAGRMFTGSPTAVRDRLTRLAAETGVQEIMVTTMTFDHQDRRRSYELLAETFGLAPRETGG